MKFKKFGGLLIIIFFAVVATVPGWSIIGFGESLAKNENVARYIFYFISIVVVGLLIIASYKWLLDEGDN